LNQADIRQTEKSFSEITAVNTVSPENITPPDKPVVMLKRIGSTTYKINIHFSKTSKETMHDKITRMIKNEIATGTAVLN